MKNENKTLAGKVAVIIGAESGIGQAIAIELGNRGADIVIAYHEDDKAAQGTQQTIKDNGGKAITQQTDVSDFKQVQALFKAAHQLGTPYILVNSAGIDASGIPVVDMDIDTFDQTIRANLYGTFYTCKSLSGYVKRPADRVKLSI
jgi:glucose 1-dehydrogenase